MRKMIFAPVASLALVFAGVAAAGASPITMSSTAGGTGVQVDALGLNAGNGISVPGAGNAAGTSTFYFQANFGEFTDGGNLQFASCGGGADCFTIVAGITENVSVSGSTETFSFNGATNFFDIYADTGATGGNNETGACFANESGCNKTLVLAGSFLNNGSFSGSFTLQSTSGCKTATVTLDCFDNTGSDPGDSIDSLQGTGSFQADLGAFTTINGSFFPAGLPAGLLFETGTSSIDMPDTNVDPSQCFSALGTIGGPASSTTCNSLNGYSSVGATNGSSPATTPVMFDVTATLTPTAPAPVPEPATLTLLGFGLVAGAARLRRWTRKS